MKNKLINYLKEFKVDLKNLAKDKKNKKVLTVLFIASLFLGVVFANMFSGNGGKHYAAHMDTAPNIGSKDLKIKSHKGHNHKKIYTCSMHPQIRKDKPGKCPICGMTLIPVDNDENEEDSSNHSDKPYTVKLSKQAMALAEVQTSVAKREILEANIKLVGKIDFDETRLADITAWFPGRIEKMYVDYTGIKVSKGDHLVKIYSPELLSAQEELLQAIRATRKTSKSEFAGIRRLTRQTVGDVRNKLKLWGLTKKQIRNIERKRKTTNVMTVYSPVTGVVINKRVQEGMYVKTGSKIYSIADLNHLWVKLDAYESDISKIRFGQAVELKVESYPGEIFKGKVSFIDPVLDKTTQTIKVRVNVDNADGLLRPGMFVHATIKVRMGTNGVVMDEHLKNKFICPMHPEVIENKDGSCPICGMDLVSSKELGYHQHLAELENNPAPIVIPVSSVLQTGERAVVYVYHGEGKFEGRVVTVGERVGDHYIVINGISDGENVVTNGSFKVDSSAQILAKPSMMNPTGEGKAITGMNMPGMDMGGDKDEKKMKMPMNMNMDNKKNEKSKNNKKKLKNNVSQVFINSLAPVFNTYLKIQHDLTLDSIEKIETYTNEMDKNLTNIDMKLLKGSAHIEWMGLLPHIQENTKQVSQSKSIKELREAFKLLSANFIELKESFGFPKEIALKKFYCPMVKSYWLQTAKNTLNPYFGQSMLTCGEQK